MNTNYIIQELYFNILFPHQHKVCYYVILTSSWQPKSSRLSSDLSDQNGHNTKLFPPENRFPFNMRPQLMSSRHTHFYNYRTTWSLTWNGKTQERSHLHNVSTSKSWHWGKGISNPEFTNPLKKLTTNSAKQPNCDKNTRFFCVTIILQTNPRWPNLNADTKTTFHLISQDCFHCTHLHQQDKLLLRSFPPPQALVQVQKSWPLHHIRYELIPFLKRTQRQSGTRHRQGPLLWKKLRGQTMTMKL